MSMKLNSMLKHFSELSLKENSNGKVEILQDLDLFYIKQLAHNFKVSKCVDDRDLWINMSVLLMKTS